MSDTDQEMKARTKNGNYYIILHHSSSNVDNLLNNHGQQEKTRALMEYKLDELTKRVDKHNHVVERTYSIERELSIQKEQIKVANHRIEDLEGIEHEH